jgi:2-C-methyl-D-erythritol 4-phosphate cytidylyltransferase
MKTRENKIFLKLNGKPIIYYTMKTFSDYKRVDAIVVTTGEENIPRLEEIIRRNEIKKVFSVEKALQTRQESTYHAIEKIKDLNLASESFLLIHNAVNPFVRHRELDRCLDAAEEYGASLLGFQATDTVKIINPSKLIDYTPNRDAVWIAQTPQVLRFDIAVRAFERAFQTNFIATDDTTLVETIHEKVKFVECSRENFKITYPQDLELAQRIYVRRLKETSVWYV